MTQEATHYSFPRCVSRIELNKTPQISNSQYSGAVEVANCVERLIKETNDDLKNFRAEQSHLRAHISSVLDENHNLSRELSKYKQMLGSGDTKDIHQRLDYTGDALSKAMAQIDALQKERRCLQKMQECSERTISNMESELNSYRAQLPLDNTDQVISNTAV